MIMKPMTAREPAQSMTRVLIVGGGTAGHVEPGIAIGEEFVRRGIDASQVHFVGSVRGVEATLVPAAGFDQTLLPGRGIQRRLTRDNIGAVLGLAKAFVIAGKLLRTHRPEAVVSLGGYASVPAGLWAGLRKVPTIVAEQNAVPGLANRVVSKLAKKCAASFEDTNLPRVTVTGNPVRADVLAQAEARSGPRAEARRELGLSPDQFFIVAFGGSLGAGSINSAVFGAAKELMASGVVLRHIVGSRNYDDAVTQTEHLAGGTGRGRYEVIEYEHDMAKVLAAADLAVCRAGATTCAELAIIGIPAVMIPLPNAPADHQMENAQAMARVGAVEVVPDSILDARLLIDTIRRLRDAPGVLVDMAESALTLARPNAAAAVVNLAAEFVDGLAPVEIAKSS